jgi:hypothetical protein
MYPLTKRLALLLTTLPFTPSYVKKHHFLVEPRKCVFHDSFEVESMFVVLSFIGAEFVK